MKTYPFVDGVIQYFFGSDVFISYARADAFDYAGKLASLLINAGITAYLDQTGSEPGEKVPLSVLRAAHRARVLVLVATPAALASAAVAEEVATFPKARPIVPIALEGSREGWPDWTRSLIGLPVGVESEHAIRDAAPSAAILERVKLTVGRWRQLRRIRVAAQSGVALIIVAGLTSAVLGYRLTGVTESLGDSTRRLADVNSRLTTTGQDLMRIQDEYGTAQNRLMALQSQIASTENRLKTVTKELESAQRGRRDQVAATVELWDLFENGMQELFPQPELNCKAGLPQGPISVYVRSDTFAVNEAARALLQRVADCYRASSPTPWLAVEGHVSSLRRGGDRAGTAEEAVGRNTAEYNLALGDRQAAAVRDYLVSLGVPANRVTTRAIGSERPASFPVPFMNNRTAVFFRSEP